MTPRALAVAFLCLAFIPAKSAHAWDPTCWIGGGPTGVRQWRVGTKVEVYVSLAPNRGVQEAGYDVVRVALSVQAAIARWNQSGAHLQLSYAGTTLDSDIDGGIVVRAGGCSNFAASAGAVTDAEGYILRGGINLNKAQSDGAGGCLEDLDWPSNLDRPWKLTDVLAHELGHTMGRADAYNFPTDCSANACGNTHATVMDCSANEDLTAFDRADHRSVYPGRAPLTRLKRRSLSGTTWSSTVDLGTGNYLVHPGPGASAYTSPTVPVAVIRLLTSGATDLLLRELSHAGTLTAGTSIGTGSAPINPTAVAYAPDGTAVMAYVLETGGRTACYRTRSSAGTWGAEVCDSYGVVRNGAGAAYDPISGRFIVVYNVFDAGIPHVRLLSVPRPGNPYAVMSASILEFAAETPALACADTQPIDAPLYTNCRLAFASMYGTNDWGQRLTWIEMGIDSRGFVNIGTRRVKSPYVYTEHAPAMAWFAKKFHLVYSRWDRELWYMSLTRSGTSWSESSTPLNDTGFISPPFLSPTRDGGDKLHLLWLSYPEGV